MNFFCATEIYKWNFKGRIGLSMVIFQVFSSNDMVLRIIKLIHLHQEAHLLVHDFSIKTQAQARGMALTKN